MATQDPRKTGDVEIVIEKQPAAFNPHKSKSTEKEAVCQKEYLQEFTPVQATTAPNAIIDNDPKPKSLAIRYGDTGYSYDKLFADYLEGAKVIELQEPYLSHGYQMQNLTRFIESIVKIGDCKKIILTTKMGESIDETQKIQDGLEQLKAALQDTGIDFEFTFSDLIHARYIITDNGWNISLDRGLHIYQNIGRNFYLMGYYDLDLRPCLETKIVYTKVE
jgi:ATP-dependent Lon protease